MQTVNDIRGAFLDYFAKNGHKVVDSSPLVPRNDPTLMFANAGMVQFKNVFTGAETRDYKRAVTSQKCVRAGGKHNDLENVGYTARHHTFFEMLGNFSFGDYFKDLAIELAWNLVSKEFGLSKQRLLVTVHDSDEDAAALWKKIAGFPDERIIRICSSDNFWSMGDTGPCGPCSEIFYDHGDHIPGGPPGTPEEDGDRFVEIWNLVFMQFQQTTKEERLALAKPSIDTGMGLERVAAVMQGVHDNYEIDLMKALISASADASNVAAEGPHGVSHRVVADHLRSSCFLIADGVLPSNEGRGYVLRRIMRRAMRHAHMIGCRDPLMHRLVPALVKRMGAAFPELGRSESLIAETLKLEETRFRKTLDKGLKLLEDETAGLNAGDVFSGDVAFKLYDTYGFPLDLTQDVLKSRRIAVDMDGFDAAMKRRKADARAAWSGSGEAATEAVWFALRDKVGATEFLGYEAEKAEGRITAMVVDGESVDEAAKGTEVALLANQTPFYGESGGQVGDAGFIAAMDGVDVAVSDTQRKVGDLHVHIGMVTNGILKVGAEAKFEVDHDRRSATRANHSATHLLHAALRAVLGDHVTQKGSLVGPDRLRFDISHSNALKSEEIREVEVAVNNRILENTLVTTRLMDPKTAVQAGAMALFGEKYGEEARVVSMGSKGGKDYSIELCGGTHVRRTGDIGLFKLVSEGAVAAGVRRIEAVTGRGALAYLEARDEALRTTADLLRVRPRDVPKRIEALLAERKKLERDLQGARRRAMIGGVGSAMPDVRDVGGVKFAPKLLDDVPAKDLKGLADDFKKRVDSGVVALVSVMDAKVSLVVAVTEDLTGRVSAVDLVRAGSAAVGGKGGGGRPDMAQAGGPNADKALEALTAIERTLAG